MSFLHKSWLLLNVVIVLPLMVGCQTAIEPITGRKQFILTDAQAEMRMGLDAWNEILGKEQLSQDKQKTAALKRVGGALSKVIDQSSFEWEFQVFSSESANAFCLPGGKVGVYEGLFEFTVNDAELAAVVGHEIGHAVARHGGERMTQSILQNLGALGLSVALGSRAEEDRVRWMAAYVGVTTVGVVLPYSRTHEYAADELGMIYMARAGYDPAAAVSFWEKFSKDSKTPSILEFLSTHPVGSKRLGRLREILPRAQLEYETAMFKHGLGQSYTSGE
jgi:predicted Zn-dependent protease